ncbi:DDE-domain-containing protein [Cenococcum geophilum 1.58]|uniref:DDE-domain-containing protein n=1 Tax=Cenococcum geophilum 1.58 TaxID=794803 RepID=UPI00358F187C|nr:DDE-domain-containing protein [Cenococcum geophilum 1.58]
MSRQLDCQRAWNDDPVIINDWFKFFRSVRDKYSIKHSKFIHNFDEKGVMLGRAATARIIVSGRNSRERSKNRTVRQPGSRESVSIIETITADGSYLPPFLIWQGQQHQETWYQITEHNERLRGYAYATSTNGWTDDSLGLHYIEHYDKYTRQLVEDAEGNIRSYRMHLTWQFIQYALSRKIVLVALPPHSTHKLQPLDVGCFGPLQHYYGVEVDNFCRYGHIGVNKEYFMKLYPTARAMAFTRETICEAWKATGLLPYNPTAVLKTLPQVGPSAGLETNQLITNINPQTPRTPKTVKDL